MTAGSCSVAINRSQPPQCGHEPRRLPRSLGTSQNPHSRAPGRLLTRDRRAEKGKIAAGRAMAGKLRLSAETELDRAGAGPGCATSKALPRNQKDEGLGDVKAARPFRIPDSTQE
jgi:hypothetical protein